MASIYHVTINGQQCEVESTSTAEAIKLALDSIDDTDQPDQCLIDSNRGICVCAEYAGESIEPAS